MTRKFGALDQSVVGSHTESEWSALVREWKWRCFYCAKPICKNSLIPDAELTKDHMLPISRGGSDFIWNIVPSCQHCNDLKGNMTVDEFRTQRPGAQKPSSGKQIHISTGVDTASTTENFHKQENSETVNNVDAPPATDMRTLLAQWQHYCGTAKSMNDGYPADHDSNWYQDRKAMLKAQAAGMRRIRAEAAGQLTLAIFGDNDLPKKVMETDPATLVVAKGMHVANPPGGKHEPSQESAVIA